MLHGVARRLSTYCLIWVSRAFNVAISSSSLRKLPIVPSSSSPERLTIGDDARWGHEVGHHIPDVFCVWQAKVCRIDDFRYQLSVQPLTPRRR
ncbi:hypothetical protein KCP78_01745 [Salmonella enterica subsp. enterica]|nr:hypothetical protein KCP78_01745 [Salmonella enterica subsp. enterica]